VARATALLLEMQLQQSAGSELAAHAPDKWPRRAQLPRSPWEHNCHCTHKLQSHGTEADTCIA
jgi:hypothetical protein